ncbi:MAG TPA: EAL domain-containing protein [Methylophilus sp.]|nr:EAL domain-containing protein [Methylophilus sp.]HQQ34196.1 EAL domain-containing protein [Methylophilus sp.]
MRNFGIKGRVILLGTLPAVLFAIILAGYAISNVFKLLDQSLEDRGRIIAAQLAPSAEYGVISGNHNMLQKLANQALSSDEDISAVLVTDKYGQALALSGRPIPTRYISSMQEAHADFLKADNVMVFTSPVYRSLVEIEDYTSLEDQLLTEKKKPVSLEIGRIYVTLNNQSLLNLKKSLIAKMFAIGGFGLLLSALIAWQIGRNITKPIQEIAWAVNKVGEGLYTHTIKENSSGELGTLQKGFNSMAKSLRSAYDNMQERIHEATDMLRYQAQHDDLTGLINRREFESRLDRVLSELAEARPQHVLCYLDLDQFKLVNDTCGHGAGDELLKQISVLFAHRVRDKDTLARVGGDEFGLLLENCSLSDAQQICNDLLKLVRDYRFVHEDKVFNVGLSIGMVVIDSSFQSSSSIMQAADAACYSAKKAGKNQSYLYSAGDIEMMQRQSAVAVVSDITSSIDDEQFVLYCQPIVPLSHHASAKEKALQHYEVLIRKFDASGQLVMPTAFISSAERYHLMPNIDRWVIKNTFAAYRQLLDVCRDNCNYLFSVNLSGTSLSDKSLLGFIREQFAIYAIPPSGICFEITETSAIVNLKNTINLFTALRKIGCKFALDDFGSGMSSFMYLKNFEVDYLKIEGSFVREMHTNKIDHAMVQSIHSVAEALNIKTVAEFVESDAVLDELRAIGIHYGQGMHLGAPVAIKKLIEKFTGLNT